MDVWWNFFAMCRCFVLLNCFWKNFRKLLRAVEVFKPLFECPVTRAMGNFVPYLIKSVSTFAYAVFSLFLKKKKILKINIPHTWLFLHFCTVLKAYFTMHISHMTIGVTSHMHGQGSVWFKNVSLSLCWFTGTNRWYIQCNPIKSLSSSSCYWWPWGCGGGGGMIWDGLRIALAVSTDRHTVVDSSKGSLQLKLPLQKAFNE